MIIGGKKFDVEHETYVMGILNVTPDSFSDGGKYNGMDQAMEHARQMVEDGADIIDVGGESTRPGHIMITDEEEIARVTPIIEKLKKEFDVPISIDTYKSKVAEAAVQAGADLVNDIWGLKYDKKIAGVIAKYNVAVTIQNIAISWMILWRICGSVYVWQRRQGLQMIRLFWIRELDSERLTR